MTTMVASSSFALLWALLVVRTGHAFVVNVGRQQGGGGGVERRRVALAVSPSLGQRRIAFQTTTTTATTRKSSSLLLLQQASSTKDTAATEAATVPTPTPPTRTNTLDEKQLDFMLGYLNKHHGTPTLVKFAQVFTELGQEMANKNVWSGGSMKLVEAKIVHIDTSDITLDVLVYQRDAKENDKTRRVSFSLDSNVMSSKAKYQDLPIVEYDADRLPIDDIVRRLNRLCWIVKDEAVTGKLIQLALQLGGAGIGKIPDSLYLNQVPHNRYVRDYFYQSASKAVHDAVVACSEGKLTNRLQVVSQFPEMNPSMDSYRIGTILEMCRSMCICLAEENVRVRLCVQGSMGVGIFTGVPKQLNGVSKLIQMMDWQSEEGEENEGMVGDFVNFGAVGPEHVQNEVRDPKTGNITQHQDDVFIIIAPQSMVGTDSSIIPNLEAMVQAAGDRPVILINPDLTDKVSAAGQQSVRGRQQRIDFANSFETIWQFQNIYVSGTSYFPILGAMTKMHLSEPWVAHQRRDYADGEGEVYVPVLSSETKPSGEAILENFER